MSESASSLYLIAGGTGGIGTEVVRRLRVAGAEVAVAARNQARLDECAREQGVRAIPMDATDSQAVARGFDTALGDGARLAGVVNCVGSILLKPAHLTSYRIRVNCVAPEQGWVTGQVLHVDGGLSTVQAR